MLWAYFNPPWWCAMKNFALSLLRSGFLTILAGGLISSVAAQEIPSMEQGIPSDWSMHHVIFSNPGTEQEAIANGSYERWLKVVNDPRYIFQQLKRGEPVQGPAAEAVAAIEAQARAQGRSLLQQPGGIGNIGNGQLKGLWEENMGTNAKVGADQYPSTYSVSSSPSCSDFAVYNTNLAGSATSPTIVGYTNLYSGLCTAPVPKVNWAYNTTSSTDTTIFNSVSVSPDGTQIVFVQNNPSAINTAAAQLVLLKWKAGTGTVASPVAPTSVTAANYRTCTAPCMLVLTFSSTNGGNNSAYVSAPYYDIADDIIYVGDDGPNGAPGLLHKFTGVFNGTPAEVATTAWPAIVASGENLLTSPVYDSASGNIFVGDTGDPSNIGVGGYFHSVSSAGTIVGTSSQLDVQTGIIDAPIVDSSNGRVYVSVGRNSAGNSAVYQFPTNFTSGAGTSVTVGTGGTLSMYDGQFDNQYYTSSNGTGGLYVCGNTGGDATVYQIPITASVMGTVKTGPAMTTANRTCSPVAENLAIDAATTLNGAINNLVTSVALNSATGFNPHDFIQIDSEIMQITLISSNTLTVIRHQFGTSAAGHNNLAAVEDIHDRLFLSVEARAATGVTGCTSGSNTVGCVFNFDLTVGSGSTETTEILPTAALSGLN